MIKNKDRSGWFGASDTAIVMGNWDTESFFRWWMIKLGLDKSGYSSWIMECGNIMEVPIIRAIEKFEKSRIRLGKRPRYSLKYRVRVNYDGITSKEIIEIKTSGKVMEKVPKNYWQQCQVLMWKTRRKMAKLYAYKMEEEDYLNPYIPTIDTKRLSKFEIPYDAAFIESQYLPRVRYLAKCLRGRKFPVLKEVKYD